MNVLDEPQAAHRFLAGLNDPIAQLARRHGPVTASLPSHGLDPGDSLGRLTLTIVGQSISTKAALAVFTRLVELLGGNITAEGLVRTSDDELRAIGLSYAKARAIRDLGSEVLAGRFRFAELEAMSDADAEARLVGLRGIGPWSAQMHLLRAMGRPDVFPAGDLGIRHALRRLDALDEMPSIRQAAERALPWRPYRSYAAKYLWIAYSLDVA